MQILFATNLRLWGGGEKWMLTAARWMADHGHSVTLAAPEDSEIYLRAHASGLPTLAAGFVRDVDPVSFGRVYRHCLENHVDVLCLNMDRVLRVAGLAAKLAGVPVVLPRRGSEFPLKSHFNYRFQYQVIASGVLVNSLATAEALCRGLSWRPRGRVRVVYNGLRLDRIEGNHAREHTRERLDWGPDDIVLIQVGELTERKNARLAIEALVRLPEHVRLVLAGEGSERDSLTKLARELGLVDRVQLLGFREDVPALLAAADILVHCAHVEGFGFAVAEGQSHGLPAVVANTSSLPEVIRAGETGALFEDDDVDGLVAALQTYVDDEALRVDHGYAGREHVRACFDLNDRMRDLVAIFEKELSRA